MPEIAANPLAVAKISAKTPVLSPLPSWSAGVPGTITGWPDVPIALRDRAQFSATVENLRLMQNVQNRLELAIGQLRNERGVFVNEQNFIAAMQKIVREEGLGPADPKDAGTLKDIGSEARLRLIYRTQVQMANEYARWRRAQDPGALNAFPAQEFLRVASRKKPRSNWPERFARAGGRIVGGRMVALMNDPVWRKLNVFGNPYPPFDYGSGMGLRSLSRREAESLGLIKPGEEPKPAHEDFNANLEASVADLSPEYQAQLKKVFGDQVVIQDNVAKWQGNIIADLYRASLENAQLQKELTLGNATAALLKKAGDAGVENLADFRMVIRADEIRKVDRVHGENEPDIEQAPITKSDWEAVPHIWRAPDLVVKRGENNFILTRRIDGVLYVAEWIRNRRDKTVMLRTLYKKIVPGS